MMENMPSAKPATIPSPRGRGGACLFLLALAGCNHDPAGSDAQTPASKLTSPASTASAANTAPTTKPEPTASAATAASDGKVSAGESVEPGNGRCNVDDDCVLSSYQGGCCVQACSPNAWNKADLAREIAAEDCAKHRGPCPPPSPCPVFTSDAVRAICQSGTCATVRRPRAGKP